MLLPLLVAVVADTWVLREEGFDVARPSEVVAVLTASCERCAWGRKGREAAVLALSVDGRYSQHLVLVQGRGPAEYRLALGALAPGPHRLTVALDRTSSAPGVRRVSVDSVELQTTPEGAGTHTALALAPMLEARDDTLARFTDVPLMLFYETDPTPRGTRIRYSVVFSGEDQGEPADRLMATRGRTTGLEYVYGVEVDAWGRVLEEETRGTGGRGAPFAGRREGRHPLLRAAMGDRVSGEEGPGVRFAPAPFAFGSMGLPSEAVMDANPWAYRVMIQELGREGLLVANARPGSERIPDPRRFLYVEACAELADATLAFAVGAERRHRVRWHESDAGGPLFRIDRSGCFRGAVALPPGAQPDALRALRFRAYTRPPREGEPPVPSGAGTVRLTRVNRVFLLDKDGVPGPSLFSWEGDRTIRPGELPLELDIATRP